MDDDPSRIPDDAVDQAGGTATFAVVVILLCLVSMAVAGVAVLEPGILVALLPRWSTGATSYGRALQVVGASVMLLPVLAAVVAYRRGRRRLGGWLVVLALLAIVPGGTALEGGTDRVRRAGTVEAPADQPCAEFSGGDTKCPGG